MLCENKQRDAHWVNEQKELQFFFIVSQPFLADLDNKLFLHFLFNSSRCFNINKSFIKIRSLHNAIINRVSELGE